MYCSACKVQFPDNLNFCKQCGRPLVSQPTESASLSKCCTRCGARVVAGENFCQQCGARSRSKSEDTTIGACQQCSTRWRSAWLYCRNCGLDRDRALDLASMPALPNQEVPTVTMQAVSVPKAVDAGLHCPRCGAPETPYAQFCDVCGHSLTSDEVGPIDVDTEVHQITLELPAPAFDLEEEASFDPVPDTDRSLDRSGIHARAEEEEEPLDPSRTTDRVLAMQLPAPEREAEANAETYSTKESTPVRITELYYGDELSALPKTSPVEEVHERVTEAVPAVPVVPPPPPPPPPATKTEHHRTTSFEPSRSTSQVSSQMRMTIENKALSTGQIKELVNSDLEDEVDYLTPALGAKAPQVPPSASLYATSPGRSRRAAWQTGAIVVCVIALGILVAIIAWQEIGRRRLRADSRTSGTVAASPSPAVAPAGMIFIPGGTINMGREGGDEFERPIHPVTVAPFYIDRNEVSNEDYERFVTVTGRPPPSHWRDGRFPQGQARFPVVNVTWQDAVEYAKWAGKRLPTETEWEFAARGTEGRVYPWGALWETGRANTKEAGRARATAVGSFPQGASQYGVLDMCGNVWEWTASELTNYGEDHRVLAPGRVIRGGAWDVARDRSTATYRGVVQPDRAYAKTGFRCVK